MSHKKAQETQESICAFGASLWLQVLCASLEAVQREHVALAAVGNGKSYLGKQVIEWAKTSPDDARIPEALYIAAQANASYKNGCDGWEFDEKTKQRAETILRQRYPQSPWTAKLTPQEGTN